MERQEPHVTLSENAAAAASGERLLSLDGFRGLTIPAMIVVNNPGRWGDQYWPLAHANWHVWHDWLDRMLFRSRITDPKAASLGFALAIFAFWWLVLWVMAQLGWSIRKRI